MKGSGKRARRRMLLAVALSLPLGCIAAFRTQAGPQDFDDGNRIPSQWNWSQWLIGGDRPDGLDPKERAFVLHRTHLRRAWESGLQLPGPVDLQSQAPFESSGSRCLIDFEENPDTISIWGLVLHEPEVETRPPGREAGRRGILRKPGVTGDPWSPDQRAAGGHS